jgi:hypothetical protein
MELLATLTNAIGSGEVVEIIYHGGSQPGKSRHIQPRNIKDDKLRAFCIETKALKTFLLSKVSPVEPVEGGEESTTNNDYDAELPKQLGAAENLPEAMKPHIEELQDVGWGIMLDEQSISLHRFFKSGKPKKTPVVSLTYIPMHTQKPWRVESEELPVAKSYGHFYKAAVLFLEHAKLCKV